MRKKVILITGANGEVGHGLIEQMYSLEDRPSVVVLDIRGLEESRLPLVDTCIVGDILDTSLLDTLMSEYEIDTIYHLAALLSTHSEFRPEAAHRVNVQGTINLLQLAIEQGALARTACQIYLPQLNRSVRRAQSGNQGQAAAVERRPAHDADHDVRLQQTLL